jgi:hypothetical protein
VCWKPRSSCWSLHLLREEFLSAPIHSPPLWFAVSVLPPGPICKTLIRWKDRHADKKLMRDSLKKSPQPSHGSQIQRLRTRARAVSHAMSPAHGFTVDRPHNPKGYAILSVHARSNGPDPVHAGAAANTPRRKTARWRAVATCRRCPWTVLSATNSSTGYCII